MYDDPHTTQSHVTQSHVTQSHITQSHMTESRAGESWQDEEFWAAFDEPYDTENRPTPWYRKFARVFAGLAVLGMVATGALIPWGTLIDRLDNISDPFEIREYAESVVDESAYAELVTDMLVRPIGTPGVGGFVSNNPATGLITVDHRGWDPDDLRSVVDHEIGHLIDFAAWGPDSAAGERRGGLGSEAWAECASVDAGSRNADGGLGDTQYHCTNDELAIYQATMDELGEVCSRWGERSCLEVSALRLDGR